MVQLFYFSICLWYQSLHTYLCTNATLKGLSLRSGHVTQKRRNFSKISLIMFWGHQYLSCDTLNMSSLGWLFVLKLLI